jgi:hypothetical protein
VRLVRRKRIDTVCFDSNYNRKNSSAPSVDGVGRTGALLADQKLMRLQEIRIRRPTTRPLELSMTVIAEIGAYRGPTTHMPVNDPTEVGLDTANYVIARRVHGSACRNWCPARGPTVRYSHRQSERGTVGLEK